MIKSTIITVKALARLQAASEQSWDSAIASADPEYAGGSAEKEESLRQLAAECDAAYAAAIKAVRAANWSAAREQLEQARALEDEGGDGDDARRALELLAKVTP